MGSARHLCEPTAASNVRRDRRRFGTREVADFLHVLDSERTMLARCAGSARGWLTRAEDAYAALFQARARGGGAAVGSLFWGSELGCRTDRRAGLIRARRGFVFTDFRCCTPPPLSTRPTLGFRRFHHRGVNDRQRSDAAWTHLERGEIPDGV
jgi:hypothetical protein